MAASDFWWTGNRLAWRGNSVGAMTTDRGRLLAERALAYAHARPHWLDVQSLVTAKKIGHALQVVTRKFVLLGLSDSDAQRYVNRAVLEAAAL